MLPPAFRNAPLSWLRSAAGSRKGGELPSFSVGMAEVRSTQPKEIAYSLGIRFGRARHLTMVCGSCV